MKGKRMVSRNRKWDGNPRNACLTVHQPWASLLVLGIKRVEARSWPAPFTGQLWIHAAGKVPEPETIKAVEEFYKQLYALEGITDLKFPEYYPLQVLLGCVEVVGCVEREELESWEDVSQGVRLEALHDFCWLCEDPQKLLVEYEMRGYPGIFNLNKKVLWAAQRSLGPIEAPLPVSFPPLDYEDSLDSEDMDSNESKTDEDQNILDMDSNESKTDEDLPPALKAALDGVRAVVAEFSKKPDDPPT